MKPKSLSATAAHVYECCPARYKAEQLEYVPRLSGTSGNLGRVCHSTLEQQVKLVLAAGEELPGTLEKLLSLYESHYYNEFSDQSSYFDGEGLLRSWHKRQDFTERRVISVEEKSSFELPTPDTPTTGKKLKFNFIMDRLDERTGTGEVEVVDYKTGALPMTPDKLRTTLQARAYALAAQFAYPDARRIWVTFDLLRFDPVSVAFKKEENRATYHYLREMVARIWDDDGTTERLNPECRFCVRANVCSALRRHINGGGILALSDPKEAADQRAELSYASAAIKKQLEELDEFLMEHCEQNDTFEIKTDKTKLTVGAKRRRHVNAEEVTNIVGPVIAADYGTMNVGAVGELLKDPRLTDAQKSAIKQAVEQKFTSPSVSTEPLVKE